MYRFILAVLSVLVYSAGSPMLATERPYLRTDSGQARQLRYSEIYATAWYGTEGTINLHIIMSWTPSNSMTFVKWLVVNDTARDLYSVTIGDREYECSNGNVITVKGNWWTDPLEGRRVDDTVVIGGREYELPRGWMRRVGGTNPDIILHKKSPRGQKECPRITSIRLKGDPKSLVKYLINKGDKDVHGWGEGGRVEVYRKVSRRWKLEIK